MDSQVRATPKTIFRELQFNCAPLPSAPPARTGWSGSTHLFAQNNPRRLRVISFSTCLTGVH